MIIHYLVAQYKKAFNSKFEMKSDAIKVKEWIQIGQKQRRRSLKFGPTFWILRMARKLKTIVRSAWTSLKTPLCPLWSIIWQILALQHLENSPGNISGIREGFFNHRSVCDQAEVIFEWWHLEHACDCEILPQKSWEEIKSKRQSCGFYLVLSSNKLVRTKVNSENNFSPS